MKYTAIQDHVGRTVIGKVVEENDTTLVLQNPVILHVQPEANGSLQVQTFPVFFFEFLDKDSRESNNWRYSKASIVTSDVKLTDTVISQYEKINTPQVVVPAKNNNPKVISIDDL